jgi:predicted RNA-binding protein
MCELKIISDNAVVFENAIYAKAINNNVLVKDIMGKSKEFKNHRIIEVNIARETLIIFSSEMT